jgi:hypothetical protein
MRVGFFVALLGLIMVQGYRLQGTFTAKDSKEYQLSIVENPCQRLEQYPVEEGSRMRLLLVNCWSKLKYPDRYPKEVLFPLDFGRRFRDFQKVYDLAIQERKGVRLDVQDQEILSTLLEGDEMRRIQGLYFLCAHPLLYSQISMPQETVSERFDSQILDSCRQNIASKTGLLEYFRLSKEAQKTQFQEYIVQ